MSNLADNPTFPTILSNRNANELTLALLRQGLRVTLLIAAVSGTKDLLAWVWGECKDKKTGEVLEFEATWRFDWSRVSSPMGRYYLDELEIIE